VALYTFGGNASAVLTTTTGDVVPDYPVLVRAAGTGAAITALYEEDGITPIAQLRSNPADSDTPGAVRTFKVDGFLAIQYEYNGPSGQPVRIYEVAREAATSALEGLASKLDKTGGTVTGDLNVTGTVDAQELLVNGAPLEAGADWTEAGIYLPPAPGSAGIQSALDAARDAGGGWVIVPAGVWLINDTLRIYRHTRLTLLPGAELRENAPVTMLLNGDADQTFGGYTGHGDILIEGGVWNMRGTTEGLTGNRMCISIGHARGITIRDIEVRDVSGFHGIELNSTKNAVVENCKFLGYVDNTTDQSRSFSEAIQLDLAKSSGAFGGFGPYDQTVCEDITIRGCYVGASGTAGTTAWPRGVGSHSATVGTTHRRIRITDNTFEGLLQYGIVAYAYDDCVIAGNTMKGCGAGIRCRVIISADAADSTNLDGVQTNASQAMKNLAITGNTITVGGSNDDAILLYGETTGHIVGAAITGNTIDTVGGAENGIRIQYADQYTVSGNTLRAVGGTAISQEQNTGGTIVGNRIYQPTGAGISADTCTDMTIDSNAIREAGGNGLWALGGSDIRMRDNSVQGASRAASGSYGIRISSSTAGILIAGNRVRNMATGTNPTYALSITNTCSGVRRYGNDLTGAGTSGQVDDQSASPVLSPYDSGTGTITQVKKPADTDRNSTITPAADPDLTQPVAANATYDVECVAVWSNGGGGFRATWAVPSGTSMTWTDNDGVGQTSPSGVVTFSATTGTTLKGTLTTGSTAGSISLSWAQNTSNAGTTSLRAGCSLKLTRTA
jgi:hypothetical protein